jgi:hypothetical protein
MSGLAQPGQRAAEAEPSNVAGSRPAGSREVIRPCAGSNPAATRSVVNGIVADERAEAMADTHAQINFDAPAVLRKWPSQNNERISHAFPYLVSEGTLDECVRQLTSKPASQRHLYEIHTAPQGEVVSAVLSAEQIIELGRLRAFL